MHLSTRWEGLFGSGFRYLVAPWSVDLRVRQGFPAGSARAGLCRGRAGRGVGGVEFTGPGWAL